MGYLIVIAQVRTRWPEIYGCSKQTLSLGYALGLGLFTAINPYNYNMSTILSFSSQPAGGVLEGSEETVQWATEWYSICSCVLGRELSIWDEFLRPLLLERAKVNFTVHALVYNHFQSTYFPIKQALCKQALCKQALCNLSVSLVPRPVSVLCSFL